MNPKITVEQKRLLRKLYLLYGENIPYCYGGFRNNSDKLEYEVFDTFGEWWIGKFMRNRYDYETNSWLTYYGDDFNIPVTVTKKFIDWVMED